MSGFNTEATLATTPGESTSALGTLAVPRVVAIPNAHIDPVWIWDWHEGLHEVLQTFRAALEKGLAHGGPYLIDVEVPRDSEVTPWTFIHPAKP